MGMDGLVGLGGVEWWVQGGWEKRSSQRPVKANRVPRRAGVITYNSVRLSYLSSKQTCKRQTPHLG